ncbi:carbonic anhydrase [Stella humosa]|uniref:Carbonic anhydrase n=1 Tax=Stella humosa TaxID=94 RepID=A0A3N1L7H4_9PROT|nr:carbonic anhydrase [Stella humosa]ROP90563.1 carbonic anhydrase [Stella humosa]BBK29542.1 carbonic anhydrase [Stella humosa]
MIAGIRQFKARFYEAEPARMRLLVDEGQAPAVMMIACSDSRVDPTLLSGAGPGELFVVRNVANLVPPYRPGGGPNSVGAAIEYAVVHLKVEHVVVFGHAHCGGIKAMLDMADGGAPLGEFIGDWVRMALDAARHHVADEGGRRAVPVARLKAAPFLVERAAIQQSLANLAGYPWVADAVTEGRLRLQGWWYDLDSGDLWTTPAADAAGRGVLLPAT